MPRKTFTEGDCKKAQEAQKLIALQKREIYSLDPNFCQECKNALPYDKRKNKFCSQSCNATYNNRKVKKPKHPCKICGKPTHHKNTYCSKDCQRLDPELIFYFDIEGWVKGEVDGGTGTSRLGGCRSAVRRYLLEEANHRCSKCGWCEVHPITGKIPLEINHIDGDAHNNKRENLEVLCPNCHSLTPNFRGLNKKSTRTHR
jgi:predicted nucleic acid-binding Zn ribbon protein